MKQIPVMKTVYSYLFPEVRPLVGIGSNLPYELFLTSTSAEDAERLLAYLYRTPLKVPATPSGRVDLDSLHVPVIERVVKAYEELVPALGRFSNRYPTAGSSEGIFHLLSDLKTKGEKRIYTLRGEYEGYKEYGKAMGLETREVDPKREDLSNLEQGVWFFSNPSARDGNIIPNDFVNRLCDSGHIVIVDLAYVGSTRPFEFDVGNKNIPAVLMSFSKPYGLFRFRVGGFTFSREPVDSLFGNKWFKDIGSLLTALKVVEEVPLGSLHAKYKSAQREIIDELNRDFSLGIHASDALLLGYLTEEDSARLTQEQTELVKEFQRGGFHRFCLTPIYERFEREGRL